MTMGLILLSLVTALLVLSFVLAWCGQWGLGVAALFWGLWGLWAPSLVPDEEE